MSENIQEERDKGDDSLAYGGICPVCGEEFTDGYDEVEPGNSYEAKICVVEKDGKDEGSMLVHLVDDRRLDLTERQRERLDEIKAGCKEADPGIPEPTDEQMLESLLDTWGAVDDGLYSEEA